MPEVRIYHNPRCSKSRQSLELIRNHHIEPKVIEYLKTPPDRNDLVNILNKLGLSASDLIRKKDLVKLNKPTPENDQEAMDLIMEHPELIERPIIVYGEKACIGRPPETILDILL